MADVEFPVSASLYAPPVSLMKGRVLPGGPWRFGDHYWEGNIGGIDIQDCRGLYAVVSDVGVGWGHDIGYRDYFGTFKFDAYDPWLWQVVTFGRLNGGGLIPTQIVNVNTRNWYVPMVFADLAAIAVHIQPTVEIEFLVLHV